jgi:hypothetical protein
MIRSGEINTARAGQLVTLDMYTGDNLLKDSDVRALRETAKDARLYNAYMHGGKGLRDSDIFLIAMAGDAKLGIQKLAWIGAELKYTIESLYTPPRVMAVTDEGYERIGKEKQGRRLKRTYTLTTLYRTLAENLIKYPETKAVEQVLANTRKKPETLQEGYVYGTDLIDPDGKGDVIEYWRGWIPYHFNKEKLDTITDLAEEIPEAHAYIMERLQALYKAKKLTVDPESVPLDKYHETPLKGSELAGMEGDIKHLSDLLNRPEHSLLDDYKDEGETEEQAENRSIFEEYKQAYAIIKNPKQHRTKDGVLDLSSLDRPLSWGYQGADKDDGMSAKAPLEIIKNNREAVNSNLHILYAFGQWRLKAGQLLGVDKSDRFKELSDSLDAIELYNSYEVYRRLLVEHILSQTYILPEFKDYTDEIVQAYQPLGDGETALTQELLNRRGAGAMDEVVKTVANFYENNKHVAKALKLIETMDIYNLEDSFYSFKDALKPLMRGVSNEG